MNSHSRWATLQARQSHIAPLWTNSWVTGPTLQVGRSLILLPLQGLVRLVANAARPTAPVKGGVLEVSS